jgi:sigma-54 specific flagellar transcriptional regulator A
VSAVCAAKAETDTGIDGLIVGESPAIVELRRLIRQVGPSDASVLVTGPSGSGKEMVARAIHAASGRAAAPRVAINCGAIPRDLLESDLFGHEKGSFTGAHVQHRGRFEEADGGTLFLDEIGDMPADMQVKLLRVLEERCVQRVGGRGQIPVDVRVVSATHRDIDRAIEEGRFREDLYYRLAVFPIEIPALAERAGDVPLLVRHFLGQAKGCARVGFTAEALERLARHDWPGNVRELKNLIERARILFDGQTVGAEQVERLMLRRGRVGAVERKALWDATDAMAPAEIAPAPAAVETPSSPPTDDVVVPIREGIALDAPGLAEGQPVALRAMLAEIEQRYIEQALTLSGGVVADAARLLSLQRTTLIEKMRKYEVSAA